MRRTALRLTLLSGMLAPMSCSAPAASRPESVQASERGDESALSVHVASWLELRERSWALDRWGLTRGDSLNIGHELLADGGLRVEVQAMHGFTGTTLVVELRKGLDGTIRAQATVKYFSDEGSNSSWKNPVGTIGISTDDWSRIHDATSTPLIIEVRLHDNPMTDDACFHAVVELQR